MASKYGWIIDADHLAKPEDRPGTNMNAVGIVGPRSCPVDIVEKLNAGQGVKFQMKDGDGELYYTGRFIGDADSEDAFGPLEDYGTPNAGATSILYERDGKWVEL